MVATRCRYSPRIKTLGEYLIEDGVLTKEQVDRALARQREMSARGDTKRLGDIALEMGLITREQLQSAVARQQKDRR